MQSSIIKMVVQMLWVKTGLFVRLGSTSKPFSALTQYCYVNYLQKAGAAEAIFDRSGQKFGHNQICHYS